MAENRLTKLPNSGNLREDPEMARSRELLAGIYKILSRCFSNANRSAETSEKILQEIAKRIPWFRGLGRSHWDFSSYEQESGAPTLLLLRRRTHYHWSTTHVWAVGTTRDHQSESSEVWLVDKDGNGEQAVTQSREYEYKSGHGTHSQISPLERIDRPPHPEDLKQLLRALIEIIKSEDGLIPVEQRSVTGVTKTLRPEIASALRFPTS